MMSDSEREPYEAYTQVSSFVRAVFNLIEMDGEVAELAILAFYEEGGDVKAMDAADRMLQALLEEVRKPGLDGEETKKTDGACGETNEPLAGYQYWEDHPKYRSANWRLDVDEGNTRAGYWTWVKDRLAEERANEEEGQGEKATAGGRARDKDHHFVVNDKPEE
jgi:hypothetical protein